MSNKFNWKTYDVPHRWVGDEDELPPSSESFTIRHLKQGATGAVKTWPVAAVLLEYLVQRGGLRGVRENITKSDGNANDGDGNTLDLTQPPSRPSSSEENDLQQNKQYNIIELGGGTGYLSAGLSLALNYDHNNLEGSSASSTHQNSHMTRLICTDNDRATIKNMRHNITSQPARMNMNKIVRVETLDWGDDVGGTKLSATVRAHFRRKHNMVEKNGEQLPLETDDSVKSEEDPIRLVSHLIASDVHYGHTTLDPLSSVISAMKLRHPQVIVVILLKERTANSVAELKEQIEAKVECGLATLECQSYLDKLCGFEVSVRNVIHGDLEDIKIVEC